MTYNIKIKSPEDAQKINRIAEKFPYEIWIHGKSGCADAKSMLGLMLLTLESDLRLVVDDNIDVKELLKELEDFIVE
jgi:phosphotransferase system HPr-like phosphotransfer protein